MAGELKGAVIAFETEQAARARLRVHGFADDIASEMAVYLGQATDLPAFMPEIAAALDAEEIEARFAEIDDLPRELATIAVPAETLLWSVTDGIRYYRGSAVPALARLLGLARYGSPPAAQYLCQDKFASLALAAAVGLACPPTLLLEGREVVARRGGDLGGGPFFVKPNTLGAKIGIFSDSRCATLSQARARAERIWARYRDRALIQPFLQGEDVRVSFLDLGGELRAQLGIFRLVRNAGGETGGDFLTMHDNETLSGARDTSGGRGRFGAARPPAFTPHMADLRPENPAAAAAIEDATERLFRLLGLTDYFSLDFRLTPGHGPVFLEFEVCPAVTIYDFHTYLRGVHGLALGAALARSFRLAHRRRSEP